MTSALLMLRRINPTRSLLCRRIPAVLGASRSPCVGCLALRPFMTLIKNGKELQSTASSSSSPSDVARSFSSEYNRKDEQNEEEGLSKKGRNRNRFRQHVNPLAKRFQVPVELNELWPADGSFVDPALPLQLDIGCGKGGFLFQLAQQQQQQQQNDGNQLGESEERRVWPKMNYLGLEIRPGVVELAQDRLSKRSSLIGTLAFLGCNANVDLDQILTKYSHAATGYLSCVTIQFPDPHFKAQHAKRRVVTDDLVLTLAKHLSSSNNHAAIMDDGSFHVLIQSDVREVFDDMRMKFRTRVEYFEDIVPDFDDTLQDNPMAVPTERELSVLKQGLPIYRTAFRRTNLPFPDE